MKAKLMPIIHRVLPSPSKKPPRKPKVPRDRVRIPANIAELLSTPTWSVSSLLPPKKPNGAGSKKLKTFAPFASTMPNNTDITNAADEEITPAKLHHLLRLSALSPPSTKEEETKLLKSLRTHIHFVRAIQSVNTRGVEPLITIRDETAAAMQEETVTLEKLKTFLELEEKVGVNGTVRRGRNGNVDLSSEAMGRKERKDWWIDLWRLGDGREERRRGNYVVVRREQRRKGDEGGGKKSVEVKRQDVDDGVVEARGGQMSDEDVTREEAQEIQRNVQTG